jgi:hypothetical protein
VAFIFSHREKMNERNHSRQNVRVVLDFVNPSGRRIRFNLRVLAGVGLP